MEEKKNENENLNLAKTAADSTMSDIEREVTKLRDPTVHAGIMYAVMRERESTNLILKNLLATMERLEDKFAKIEKSQVQTVPAQPVAAQAHKPEFLADVDQTIINHIKSKGSATAEDIQKILRYRGKNAACARLSRLAELGFLNRQRAGRVTVYTATSEQ